MLEQRDDEFQIPKRALEFPKLVLEFHSEMRWNYFCSNGNCVGIFFVPMDFALEFSAALDFPKRALEFGISIRSNPKKYSFVGKFLALIIGRGNNFKIENIGSMPY